MTPPTLPTAQDTGDRGRVAAVVGLQWGDEGKGKVVDIMARGRDAVVRYNGGANAGHSVVIEGKRHALHLVPVGVFQPGTLAVIGNGVVVDPKVLAGELDMLSGKGVDVANLRISDRAHVVMPYHLDEDGARETLLAGGGADREVDRSIGTTRRGIGPAYAEKAHRSTAVRVGDLLRPEVLRQRLAMACAFKNRTLADVTPGTGAPWYDAAALAEAGLAAGERLRPYITDTTYLLHEMLGAGKRVLFEGANGTLLDVDHGAYPFVTSSNTSALGIGSGTGVSERRIGEVVGVMKAYSTRVGGGPFPTELQDETGDRIRQRGREFGTTTGRPRRTGWLDLVAVRYAVMINNCTSLAVMLLDVLAGFDELKVCTRYRIDGRETGRFPADAYELQKAEPVYESLPGFSAEIGDVRERGALPDGARAYVDYIEDAVGARVALISVGPDRAQTIVDNA